MLTAIYCINRFHFVRLIYRTWLELDGYPYYAKHASYGGGGYVAKLTGNREDLHKQLTTLEKEGWVDKYTR